jgi:hypothetical protein
MARLPRPTPRPKSIVQRLGALVVPSLIVGFVIIGMSRSKGMITLGAVLFGAGVVGLLERAVRRYLRGPPPSGSKRLHVIPLDPLGYAGKLMSDGEDAEWEEMRQRRIERRKRSEAAGDEPRPPPAP